MLLALLACTPKSDDTGTSGYTDTDTDTDTDSDTDTDTAGDSGPDSGTTDTGPVYGFELDGGTYNVTDYVSCNADKGPWTLSAGALRDGKGAQANAYVYFAEQPAPGDYPLTPFQAGEIPPEGEAWIAFADFRDGVGAFYLGDGGSGTVTVEADGADLQVSWTPTSASGDSGTLTSEWGLLRCTP